MKSSKMVWITYVLTLLLNGIWLFKNKEIGLGKAFIPSGLIFVVLLIILLSLQSNPYKKLFLSSVPYFLLAWLGLSIIHAGTSFKFKLDRSLFLVVLSIIKYPGNKSILIKLLVAVAVLIVVSLNKKLSETLIAIILRYFSLGYVLYIVLGPISLYFSDLAILTVLIMAGLEIYNIFSGIDKNYTFYTLGILLYFYILNCFCDDAYSALVSIIDFSSKWQISVVLVSLLTLGIIVEQIFSLETLTIADRLNGAYFSSLLLLDCLFVILIKIKHIDFSVLVLYVFSILLVIIFKYIVIKNKHVLRIDVANIRYILLFIFTGLFAMLQASSIAKSDDRYLYVLLILALLLYYTGKVKVHTQELNKIMFGISAIIYVLSTRYQILYPSFVKDNILVLFTCVFLILLWCGLVFVYRQISDKSTVFNTKYKAAYSTLWRIPVILSYIVMVHYVFVNIIK